MDKWCSSNEKAMHLVILSFQASFPPTDQGNVSAGALHRLLPSRGVSISCSGLSEVRVTQPPSHLLPLLVTPA